ncbi:MAG: AAA family ATPase [Lachnospiraceae bacterium]|nr:AAA family ATPase [Lachnospiraceae bacterium]
MALFNINKKVRQMERQAESEGQVNLAKTTSDVAVDVIKELSGKAQTSGKKLVDNVVVFTNACGGAGTTTLVNNIAYTASQRQLKVLLIDLNIMCPVQHTYLGIRQDIEKPDLVSFLLGKNSLSECIDTTNEINLLYANNRTLQDEINCNNRVAIENFNSMINKCRQYYDLILVDCPMRIDCLLQNTMLYCCDAIYMVWDEGISSIINTEKLRRNMALSGIDSFTKMRIVLNKRTSVHFSDYPIKKLNLELVEVLPFDIDIIDNSLRGRIFCDKGSSTSKNAIEFARKIDVLTDKVLKIGGYIE